MTMHQDFDINIDGMTKIEGHAAIDIRVHNGRAEEVHLKINENKRFFTQAVRGKQVNNIPQLVSRICGTCSLAHLTACIECVENALCIIPSPQTRLLRDLTMYGLMIRDHALHLYLFSLPDLMGVDSVLDLGKEYDGLMHQAMHVKAAGNKLSTIVAGRAVHGMYPVVGGFTTVPKPEDVKQTIVQLKEIRPAVLDLCRIYFDSEFEFKRKTRFVAMATPNYTFTGGRVIMNSDDEPIRKEDFFDHLHRLVIPYSQATGYEYEGKEYTVGALSRMNLNRGHMHPDTKRDAAEFLSAFPSNNIFHNNLAQAVEILHSVDHAVEILEANEFKLEKPMPLPNYESEGVGVIEAPRGTLFYEMKVTRENKVKDANLVIPTQQNQINMERDIKHLVNELMEKNVEKETIKYEIEKLIRAYDPCMSCASHFLKVNWKNKK